jgi:transposase-like protein
MLKDSDITVAAVARRLDVAASTLYRHIPVREAQVFKKKQMNSNRHLQ